MGLSRGALGLKTHSDLLENTGAVHVYTGTADKFTGCVGRSRLARSNTLKNATRNKRDIPIAPACIVAAFRGVCGQRLLLFCDGTHDACSVNEPGLGAPAPPGKSSCPRL